RADGPAASWLRLRVDRLRRASRLRYDSSRMRIEAWRSRAVALLRRWGGSGRARWIALAALVLLLAVRIALPSIVRSQIESQARAAVAGTLAVGDVDL